MKYYLSNKERELIAEAIYSTVDERESYLAIGNPHVDYPEEWPNVARDQAESLRGMAALLRKLGTPESIASRCETVAASLDACAHEYKNQEVGN